MFYELGLQQVLVQLHFVSEPTLSVTSSNATSKRAPYQWYDILICLFATQGGDSNDAVSV